MGSKATTTTRGESEEESEETGALSNISNMSLSDTLNISSAAGEEGSSSAAQKFTGPGTGNGSKVTTKTTGESEDGPKETGALSDMLSMSSAAGAEQTKEQTGALSDMLNMSSAAGAEETNGQTGALSDMSNMSSAAGAEAGTEKTEALSDMLNMSLAAEEEKNREKTSSARLTGIAAGDGAGNAGTGGKTAERGTPKPDETGTSPVSKATKSPAMAATIVVTMPQSGEKCGMVAR